MNDKPASVLTNDMSTGQANAIFEGLGELYHARYGRLRPGKDEPAASARNSMDEDNCRQFAQWMKYEALDDAILLIERLQRELAAYKSALGEHHIALPVEPDCPCEGQRHNFSCCYYK